MNDNVRKMLQKHTPSIESTIDEARKELNDFHDLANKGTQAVYEYIYAELLQQAELNAPSAVARAEAYSQDDLTLKSTVTLHMNITKASCGSAIIAEYIDHLLSKKGQYFYAVASISEGKKDSEPCIVNFEQLISYFKEDFDDYENKKGIITSKTNDSGDDGMVFVLTISVSYDDLKKISDRYKK